MQEASQNICSVYGWNWELLSHSVGPDSVMPPESKQHPWVLPGQPCLYLTPPSQVPGCLLPWPCLSLKFIILV